MPPKCQQSSMGTYFVIFVLLLFFLILYTTFDSQGGYRLLPSQPRESFKNCPVPLDRQSNRSMGDYILDPLKMEVHQGVSGPVKYKKHIPDDDETKPSIDGDEKSLKSLSMVAYNRCAPECCIDSPYSCDRGCVCLTNKQYKFLGARGNNHNPISCTFDMGNAGSP